MPAGAASEAAGAQKKATRYGEMDAHKKSRKMFLKTKIFQKTSKNTDLVGRGPRESIKKEGSGRGPESDLVEDSMFF